MDESRSQVTGASNNRHRSKQDYATPLEFIEAFEKRFGPICFDLAAHAGNAQHAEYFTEEQDALAQDWFHVWARVRGWLWLNPPFNNIAPWARKCAEAQAPIALLVPASVGSNWWREHVDGKAQVFFLSPRLSFDGKNPFPKDCALCLYHYCVAPGYECWRWK